MNLLFVYNAKNGFLYEALDFAHKIVSPSTYACELCMLTHDYFSKRKEWKVFEEKSSFNMKFFHIDEFEKIYKQQYEYPVILKEQGSDLRILFDKSEIARMKKVNDLIAALEKLGDEN